MRTIKKIMICAAMTICLSCTGSHNSSMQDTSQIAVQIPIELAMVGGYNLQAELDVGGTVYQMTVNQTTNTATVAINLAEGSHNLTLTFYVMVGPIKIVLETITKTGVTVITNLISDVSFDSGVLNVNFDYDADGIVNAGEVILGSDPTDPISKPTGECGNGIDDDGDTLVDYRDSQGVRSDLSCGSWNDTREMWFELGDSATGGGISNNSGYSLGPSLALDSSGNPVVAWDDCTSGDGEIYVRRFDGSAWVDVGTASSSGGGISDNSGFSGSPSLALDSSGNPVVAWADYTSGNSEIYVKAFYGGVWGGSPSAGGISNNSGFSGSPSLALHSFGDPSFGDLVVAWTDNTSGEWEIYVRRRCMNVWMEVSVGSASGGGISNNSGISYNPSLALDSSGYPVVAWYDDTSGNREIYVKRFDESAWVWVDVGTGSSSGGGISNNSGWSMDPSLALDSSGYPFVAWQDEDDISGNNEIYVKRFNGSTWVDVGAGSSSGGGISNSSGESWSPSLALDSSGYPVVAWQDDTSGNDEIYVKRFNGSTWVDVGTGSSSGGGISNSSGWSGVTSLALDPSSNPVVAWVDDTSGNWDIYVLRY